VRRTNGARPHLPQQRLDRLTPHPSGYSTSGVYTDCSRPSCELNKVKCPT
jgi:hypothetical protein